MDAVSRGTSSNKLRVRIPSRAMREHGSRTQLLGCTYWGFSTKDLGG